MRGLGNFSGVVRLSFCFQFAIVAFTGPCWGMIKGSITTDPRHASVIGIRDCTAVIVDPRLILTAGHCISNSSKAFKFIYNINDRGRDYVAAADFSVVHKDYRADSNSSDIGVIKLSTPITEKALLASIPKIRRPTVNSKYIGVGFGDSRRRTSSNNDLGSGTKRYLPFVYKAQFKDVWVTSPEQPYTGACYGDSGGALFEESSKGQGVSLIGILSSISNTTCGLRDDVLRAVVVADHLTWIFSTTGVYIPLQVP